MEPLTPAAIAILTVLATKALEKTGENLGDALSRQVGKFVSLLKQHAPDTASAIELAPQQPLDIGQAELEVDSAAKANPEFERAVREVAEVGSAEQNPKIASEIQKVLDTLKAQQPAINNPNFTNRQDKSLFIQGTVQNSPINIT